MLTHLYQLGSSFIVHIRQYFILVTAGGPQLCEHGYTPPLYERVQVPHKLFKQQLFAWQQTLQQQMPVNPAYLTVDVAIPSYRANPDQLEKLLRTSVTEPNVSLRVLLQIDQPMSPAIATKYARGKQHQMMHQLRVRYNTCNLGAGETRNQLMEASCAQYIIFFDDDVEPTAQCIDEYVRAARQHPKASGFAGTSSHICNQGSCMRLQDSLSTSCVYSMGFASRQEISSVVGL